MPDGISCSLLKELTSFAAVHSSVQCKQPVVQGGLVHNRERTVGKKNENPGSLTRLSIFRKLLGKNHLGV